MGGKKKDIKEKPIDKMTVKELREIALQIEGLVGVHGMNKSELLEVIKEVRGIKDTPKTKAGASTKEIKVQIKGLKTKRREALADKDKNLSTRYRRQISRLKKKTRRAA
jgi:hypothetical protein